MDYFSHMYIQSNNGSNLVKYTKHREDIANEENTVMIIQQVGPS